MRWRGSVWFSLRNIGLGIDSAFYSEFWRVWFKLGPFGAYVGRW